MQLPEDFREFIALMISSGVQFVMIGGFAYNLYRNPRATGDIDFLVSVDQENEQRLRNVLHSFGFGSTLPANSQALLQEGKVIMLGRSPLRIDILTRIDGVSFDDVKSTCRTFVLDEMPVPVISPVMMLKNILASGREKDRADAAELQKWLRD